LRLFIKMGDFTLSDKNQMKEMLLKGDDLRGEYRDFDF
jgi:hypothetical protein